ADALIAPFAEPLALEYVVPAHSTVLPGRFSRGALRRERVAIQAVGAVLRDTARPSRRTRPALSTRPVETKQTLAALVRAACLAFLGEGNAVVDETRRDGTARRVLPDERAEKAWLAGRMVACGDRLRPDTRLVCSPGLRTDADPTRREDTGTEKPLLAVPM